MLIFIIQKVKNAAKIHENENLYRRSCIVKVQIQNFD